MNAGYFANSDGKFDLNSYQEVVQNGALPVELEPLLNGWEIGARTFLADRKLQTLYNQLGSVNEADVLRKYMKDNLNCTIDYIYLSISSVEDSVIEISNAQIMERYNETKDDNYKTKDIRKTEYALFALFCFSAPFALSLKSKISKIANKSKKAKYNLFFFALFAILPFCSFLIFLLKCCALLLFALSLHREHQRGKLHIFAQCLCSSAL